MSKPKSPADQAKDAFEKSALPPQRDAHKAPEGTTDDTQLDPPKPEDGNELQVDPKSEIPGTVEHTEGEPGPEPDHTFDPTAPPPQAAQKAAPSGDAPELARVLFEGYVGQAGGKTYDEKPIPSWEGVHGVGPVVRNRWRAAAKKAEEALASGSKAADFEEEPPK